MKHSTDVTPDVAAMVNRMIRSRRATQAEYQSLFDLILADGTVDETERQQINRLFDAIQTGKVRVID